MAIVAGVLATAWVLFAVLTIIFGQWWTPTTYPATDYSLQIKQVLLNKHDVTNDCVCVSIWSSSTNSGFGCVDLYRRNGMGWILSEDGKINTRRCYGWVRLIWRADKE